MRPKTSQAGFTLIEAVIAALIMMIGIVFVAQLFVTAMQQNQSSRQHTHATSIAQSKLEELNATPLERLQYGGDLGPKNGARLHAGADGYRDFVVVDDADSDRIGVVADRDKANYVRFWKIEPDPAGWQGIYRISVRVVALGTTKESEGQEVTLSTIRTQF